VQRGFWWGNLEERDHLNELDIKGRRIFKYIFEKWDGGMDWIDSAHDRVWWRALVSTEMNVWVP
jgi:hypothetical protein